MVGVRWSSRWPCSAGALAVPLYKAVFTKQNDFAKAQGHYVVSFKQFLPGDHEIVAKGKDQRRQILHAT